MSGTIPTELGNLANLRYLKLGTNRLTGPIPPVLGRLPDLRQLWLDANRLSGAIPPELGHLAGLTSLRLNNNQLSGEIPPELGNLVHLTELWLQANRLGGEIPPELGYLASLTSLLLGYNQLSGPIPPELAGLANLEVLWLESNRLSGELPPGLAWLPSLESLLVWGNQLSGALPDAPAPVRVTPATGMSPPFAEPIEVVLTEAFGGREFDEPTEIGAYPAGPGTGAGRGAFVAEREGRILLPHPDGGEAAELLDIRDRVLTAGGQDGLISVALDPRFEATGHLWLCYSVQNPALWARLSRFTVDLQDLQRVDPGSELVVLDVPQPHLGHGCGSIRFGPDGMLYLGLGDGEPGGDARGHGQNPGTLPGSVIRIDVSGASADVPYAVPPDNPFVDVPGARPEIWAYGFRNPWRMAFDPATGALWLGDVGEGAIEEIDLIEAGGNYGWNRLEGTRCHHPPQGCDRQGAVPPVVEYVHEIGCAVTGGVVYRGRAVPALAGHYLFSDWCTRRLWALPVDGGDAVEIGVSPRPVSGFAADADGEVYLSTFRGAVLRIAPPES